MSRKYVTGWFSPTDPDLMVVFYRDDVDSLPVFEAELVNSRGVVQVFRDGNLARLQADVTRQCGGEIPKASTSAAPISPPSARSWLGRLKKPHVPPLIAGHAP